METTKKPVNQYRIKATVALANAGHTLESYVEAGIAFGGALDVVAPACCREGCEVEPDGHCEHGCPSVLLALGLV